jgi:hypothetical protein
MLPPLRRRSDDLAVPASLSAPGDDDYQLPLRFNGKIEKLSVKLGPVKLTELEQR